MFVGDAIVATSSIEELASLGVPLVLPPSLSPRTMVGTGSSRPPLCGRLGCNG